MHLSDASVYSVTFQHEADTCKRQFSKAFEAQGTPLVQTTEAAPLTAFPAWLV